MKLIIAVLVFVAGLVAGGVYFFTRKEDKKKADLAAIKGLPGKTYGWMKSGVDYLASLFASKPTPETEPGFTTAV